MATAAELTYTSQTALQAANLVFGDGVTVTGASYSHSVGNAVLRYAGGDSLSPGAVPSDVGLIMSTGNARDFTQAPTLEVLPIGTIGYNTDPNRSASTTTDTNGINSNAQFNTVAGATTYDGVWLNADFIPTGNVMSMRFVFSSEEYPEYISNDYNDVVGVWINGSHVPISVGNGKINVTNLNQVTQPNLVADNTADAFNTEMDGFTLTLHLRIPVNPGVVNSIRIGIADVGDATYDSNLLIAADSVQTTIVAGDDTVTVEGFGSTTFAPRANDQTTRPGALTITHINGQPVTAGQTITLPSGQSVRLNADGTFTVTGNADEERPSFTYTIRDSTGDIDVGLVTLNVIPCFVAGTRILTPAGEVPVECLKPGDLVVTHDDGPQPLRWIGRRRVRAAGPLAPIRIRAGTFGTHRTLLVSPQHRILVRDALAELLFGETEVLVAAKELVNDRSITRQTGGMVDYVHLLFDRHQVVYSGGLATESFLPGPQASDSFAHDTAEELRALFPELDPATGTGYSRSARRALRAYETRLLFNAARAV